MLDLTQDPAAVFGGFSGLKSVVKSAPGVGPAADGGEFLVGPDLILLVPGFNEGLVGLVAVALEGAGEAGGHEGF